VGNPGLPGVPESGSRIGPGVVISGVISSPEQLLRPRGAESGLTRWPRWSRTLGQSAVQA